MKLFSLLLIVLFVSCRQNHTCECTIKTSYLENKDSIAKVTDRTLVVKNNIRDTKKTQNIYVPPPVEALTLLPIL